MNNNMENEDEEQITETGEDVEYADQEPAKLKKDHFLAGSILISVLILSGTWIYAAGLKSEQNKTAVATQQQNTQAADALSESVTPSAGVTLPVRWGDLGKKMATSGVIDEAQFKALYAQRGGMTADAQSLLDSSNNGNLVVTPQNAGTILNLLWAFGLGNRDPILQNGLMQDPQYGGAGRFASTGGWTIAVGNPMNHYSAHQFITLTADQQTLVEKVAKNIYRPCCGNATYFPDCNHGMAMLGLLELMASQGVSEADMYKAALAVNSYWFPDTYRTIARYMAAKGIDWKNVDPKQVLGSGYSSAQGYAQIQSLVAPEPPTQSQGGCAVGSGQTQAVPPQQQQGGCGV